MNYSKAVQYLFSFLNYERIPFEYGRALNLKRMTCVLAWAGHPERRYPSILVAGTKGKGSTANFISSIFSAGGYRTGLYTSPHLTDPRERIRINSVPVSRNEFAKSVAEARTILAKHRGGATPFGTLTFFELFTFAAMLCFARKKIEIAVFEVGMGGRLDATNVLSPLVSVITPVSFDHEEHLGRTLSKIAGEKAAIIKKDAPLVLGPQKPEARRIILRFARKAHARVYAFGSDFKVSNVQCSAEGSRFDFQMGRLRLNNLAIKLPGAFQVQNAACAIAAFYIFLRQALSEGNSRSRLKLGFVEGKFKWRARRQPAAAGAAELPMPEDNTCLKGLKQAFWPGRFEIVRRGGRTYVLDGAHNGASAEALTRSLKQLFDGRDILFILGVSREKALKAVLTPFTRMASSFIMTKSANVRAQEPKLMIETLSKVKWKRPAFPTSGLKEAIHLGKALAPKNSVMVITGSLFLVGEARKELGCRRQC